MDTACRDLPAGTELTSDYMTICDAVRLNGLEFAEQRMEAFKVAID